MNLSNDCLKLPSFYKIQFDEIIIASNGMRVETLEIRVKNSFLALQLKFRLFTWSDKDKVAK